MGAGGRDREAALLGELPQVGAELGHRGARVGDVAADVGAHLDDGLVHLGLDAFPEDHPSVLHDLLDVRAQLAGLRVDDLELLLDAEGEQAAVLPSCALAGGF